MPKFLLGRDIELFKSIAREVVDDVIQNTIVLFKINMNETKVNIYGEAMNKTWYPGVEVFALVDKGPQESPTSDLGVDFTWTMTFRFLRDDLISKLNEANQGQPFNTYQQPFIQYGASIHP